MDSGSTWHIHSHARDLVNLRACNKRIRGINGSFLPIRQMGDMPVIFQDSAGKQSRFTFRNVHVASGSAATLISVEQLWREQKVDVVFRDVCSLAKYVGDDASQPFSWRVPFAMHDGSYTTFCAGVAGACAKGGKADYVPKSVPVPAPAVSPSFSHVCSGAVLRELGSSLAARPIHRAKSKSGLARLPPALLGQVLHRRLHVSPEYIRRLSKFAADAPDRTAEVPDTSCPSCVEANAAHLPHSGSKYSPSYCGRLATPT